MIIEKNISLKPHTTFKIGGEAKFFVKLKNISEIEKIITLKEEENLPIFILGGGSNIIVSDNKLNLIVVKNEILGKEIISEEKDFVILKIGAGENWDDFVLYCAQNNFSGLEALSLIPGTVGGAPIQNIGAYGEEVGNLIESVEVYDTLDKKFKNFSKKDCEFSYRDSIFKKNPNRYIVLYVLFKLFKNKEIKIPNYPGVKDFLNFSNVTIKDIRETIIKIRSSKLPDPKIIPNVGSFFKNPIVSKIFFEELKEKYPDIKFFNSGDEFKIPAGWLLEKAGLKGQSFEKISVYENNALVLVNKNDGTFEEVLKTKNEIIEKIKENFGITLEMEPVIVR